MESLPTPTATSRSDLLFEASPNPEVSKKEVLPSPTHANPVLLVEKARELEPGSVKPDPAAKYRLYTLSKMILLNWVPNATCGGCTVVVHS